MAIDLLSSIGTEFDLLSIDELKSYAISRGWHAETSKASLKRFRLNGMVGEYSYIFSFLDFFPDNPSLCNLFRDVCESINNAYWCRYKRLRKRLHIMLDNSPVCFLTLDLNDKAVDYKMSTIKEYVKQFLGSFDVPYITNVDYGAEKGRLHFHAVICCIPEDFKTPVNNWYKVKGKFNQYKCRWDYGYVHIEQVGIDESDEKRVAKYVTKLTRHSIKGSTKSNKCIYSRKFDDYVYNNGWYVDNSDQFDNNMSYSEMMKFRPLGE
jgi:hypothetical protein